MRVPIFNAKVEADQLKNDLNEAAKRVIASGWYLLGTELESLEQEFSEFTGSKYSVGVHSGTDAIFLALKALGIKEGDEVITTPLTAVYTAYAISNTGATPVFVDIDDSTLQLDPNIVQKKITPKTKAIIPVHLHGIPSDLNTLINISQSENIPIIEDCAQAINATVEGKQVGTLGKLGCYSFYPTKNLGALGDGGMIVTDDDTMYKKLKLLRTGGLSDRYHYQHDFVGIHSRLDELQSSFLRIKLRRLNDWTQKRREIATKYTKGLSKLPLQVPNHYPDTDPVFHLYCIRVNERDQLRKYLEDNEVGCQIHYETPLHLQRAYSSLGYGKGDFPYAEQAAERLLSLPIYPTLTGSEQDRVIFLISEFFK